MPNFDKLHAALIQDETTHVEQLLKDTKHLDSMFPAIHDQALVLAEHIRAEHAKQGGMDSFMSTYDLSSHEGIALMCLAEALLRIPDSATADRLIADKISKGDWASHLGTSDSLFVNAATWGLLLTGKVVNPDPLATENWSHSLKGWFAKTSEPVIRQAIAQAMKILGKQYVLGETIESAMKRAAKQEARGYTYSYDMLGEAARTYADADHYFNAYEAAIHAIGKASNGKGPIAGPGISIKFSGLHPRYEFAHWDAQFKELLPRVRELAQLAKSYNIGFTIDAEEADKLELSLAILKALAEDQSLEGWEGLGLAVQAYQKRARAVLDWLIELSKDTKRRLKVRLVKGAYWDSEIKHAQEMGYPYYPVYTRKMSTDTSYLVCAEKMLANEKYIYPQFATHNAFTVAAICNMAGKDAEFEFQRLHGMGEDLYDKVMKEQNVRCRVYAPVGGHQYLLAYLVRRLLENGANTSFVNQVVSAKTSIGELVANPVETLRSMHSKPHPSIPLPHNLYQPVRENSLGVDLMETKTLETLQNQIHAHEKRLFPQTIKPLTKAHADKFDQTLNVTNPADRNMHLGEVKCATKDMVNDAMEIGHKAYHEWSSRTVKERADILRGMADQLETHMSELMALAINEAGKTLPNAVAEVREAVDFCRYYASQAEEKLACPEVFKGPTGEYDQLSYRGRGVFVTISPWNFPLAIFTGQLSAALVAGNTVVAKPAEQTSLIAHRAVELFHKAGLPEDVLQLLPGTGEVVGAALVAHPRVAGVMFTGSTEVAHLINQTLAKKDGLIVPLIAETGGQNALVVDSTALLEQSVMDIAQSAFDSAGQRCSALRVLCVQEDVADALINMIKGHMDTMLIGNPADIKTDVGPVIDDEAQQMLLDHIESMRGHSKDFYQAQPDAEVAKQGTYVPPTMIEIENINVLKREVFGPVLHVVRFSAKKLTQMIDEINATGYGLTFGVHTRIESQYQRIVKAIHAGNVYVNRNIVGAVVGVQPFGGEGLSGTGPKAGGPNYLFRLVQEQSLSVNTVAMGGNASLLSLKDDEDN